MTEHRGRLILRATALAGVAGLLLAACGGDDSSSNASKTGKKATTTTVAESTSSTDTTDTTMAAGETTTSLGSSGTTLPGGTPTTRRTTTTVRSGATTTKKAGATTTKKAGATTTTTAKPGGTTKGTLTFGTIGTSISANNGSKTQDESRKIAQAWVDQTNAAGGINGYKVAVEYRDARADTARGVAALHELEKDGVLAIVGQDVANSVLPAADDFLSAKKLPVVGGMPYTPEFDTHPMYFPVSAGYYAGVYGQVALARDMGSKYFRNLFCTEVAACGQSVPVTNAAAQREGMKGDSQGASAVASDYTANCLDAKQKGVDFLQSNGTNFANLVRDCARQNYHPNYASGGVANQTVIDA
ncbi:MAG: ABC transporter substrate-binding protein, partial [Acidobacteria bacterium]|nr:ABC transporter substrate-binding protein [Acidobacteriota bacterium]